MNNSKKYRLKQNFRFLAAGTTLMQDVNGNYFVHFDEDYNKGQVFEQVNSIRLNGYMVENTPDIFEPVKEPEHTDEELITQIAADVEKEFGMGGLADGIYLDFAIAVAKGWQAYKEGNYV